MYPEDSIRVDEKYGRACSVLKKYQLDTNRESAFKPLLKVLRNPLYHKSRPWIVFVSDDSDFLAPVHAINRVFTDEWVFELYLLRFCMHLCEEDVRPDFRTRVSDRVRIVIDDLSPRGTRPDVLRNVSEEQLQKLKEPLRGVQPLDVYSFLKYSLQNASSTAVAMYDEIEISEHSNFTEQIPSQDYKESDLSGLDRSDRMSITMRLDHKNISDAELIKHGVSSMGLEARISFMLRRGENCSPEHIAELLRRPLAWVLAAQREAHQVFEAAIRRHSTEEQTV